MKHSGTLITFSLFLLLGLLPACRTTHFRYHDHPGEFAALKVYPFWETDDGEKYLVGGLTVSLHPKEEEPFGRDDFIQAMTHVEHPLLLEDLIPGTYRLRVYLEDGVHVTEKIELFSGRRLTVRVDVEGIRQNERLKVALDRIGEFVGNAMVLIGEHLFELMVEALIFGEEDDDEDLKAPSYRTPEKRQTRDAQEYKRKRR